MNEQKVKQRLSEALSTGADRKSSTDSYRQMLLIRRTEELILRLFTEGKIHGTTHTCLGQEASAVAVIGQLDPNKDHVVSNHGHAGRPAHELRNFLRRHGIRFQPFAWDSSFKRGL